MNTFINNICNDFQKNNKITPESFTRFDIKRGLRNADGTGVIAGISSIGNVHGYRHENGVKIPDNGVLTYRGVNINDIIANITKEDRFGFEEVCYLLLVGNLPNIQELQTFNELLGQSRNLPKNFTEDMIMRAPSPNVMNKLASSTLSLYSYDTNPEDNSPENIMRQGIELISRLPVIMSYAYQAKQRYYNAESMFLHLPDKNMSTSQNILSLIRDDGKFTDDEAKLLDKCLIVHAEHGGGNNSAFTARVLSSSMTDTYSAISGAIGSLKGYRHGGANIKVAEMLDNIKTNVKNWSNEDEIVSYLEKILRKEANDNTGLIYGLGHAVYTINDPRADIVRENARNLAHNSSFAEEFDLIERIEKLAEVAYFNVRGENKKMCANVDLYTGLVYKLLSIPEDLFTPMFATSRIVGWISHRIEEVLYGGKIIRPAYKAVYENLNYTSLSKRG